VTIPGNLSALVVTDSTDVDDFSVENIDDFDVAV